jgi:hypothetical protein
MKDKGKDVKLNTAELAALDSLIALANHRGFGIEPMDLEDCETHPCVEHGDDFMGRWQDTRHEGVLFAYLEHDILPQLHRLASGMDDSAPPLRKLLNLRAAATRNK